jgi:hypothetical protein
MIGCGSDNCGWHGSGGEAGFIEPGLWAGHFDGADAGGAGVGVTPDLVSEVPIRGLSFTIELTDAQGGDWRIHGSFASSFCDVEARRTTQSGYCEPIDSVRTVPLRR